MFPTVPWAKHCKIWCDQSLNSIGGGLGLVQGDVGGWLSPSVSSGPCRRELPGVSA